MLIANYIKSAWRNILRHKLFSIINIMGLAIGLAAVMLIALYIHKELTFDSFWKNADNIYRVHVEVHEPGKDPVKNNVSPPQLNAALASEFPEIEHSARALNINVPIEINGRRDVLYSMMVDPDFLNIFNVEFVSGNPDTALSNTNSLVLNQSQASLFFDNENPIGKTVTLNFPNHKKDYYVTAVIKDHPNNTMVSINGIILIDEDDFGGNMWKAWYDNFLHTYITLNPNVSIDHIEEQFSEFVDRNYPAVPFAETGTKPSDVTILSLMNIKKLHLYSKGARETGPIGEMDTIVTFSVIAVLILIIASINFINLSTARASQRAREVVLRKVVGAARSNLIIQFIGESIVITLVALMVAFALVEISLPTFNDMIGENFDIYYQSMEVLLFIIFTALIGLLGGIYPSMILSHFHPARTLKSTKSSETQSSAAIRSYLVTIQFAVSIALFISTAVVFSQMQFTDSKQLGYVKENLFSITGNAPQQLQENVAIIVERLNAENNIVSVTYSSNFAPGSSYIPRDYVRPEQALVQESSPMIFRRVGYDFLKTYKIPLLAGRDYMRGRADQRPTHDQILSGEANRASVLINKSVVRHYGLGTAKTAIGKTFFMNVGEVSDNGEQKSLEVELEVIGVIEDVHFTSLRSTIEPEFYLLSNVPQYIVVRYNGEPNSAIETAKKIWEEELPGASFEYAFANDALANQYKQEQGEMTMFAAFSGLAIFIACLGLFGLASFTAERRTKEIGIRKVFGAEVWQIVRMLVFQFSKPVLIANIIAWPIAYLAMSRWLESFVYRIDDMVIIALCLLAGLTALLIAWATVAGNSYAVARQNPIKALRYE